ncbi:MAG: alpha/beta hydrolase [Ilumatobacteraceae bacterium]
MTSESMIDEMWAATTGPTDGPHLVLVHGSLDRSAGLLKLSRRLDDRFRVTRYDRRGYGRSAPHPGPFGIDHQVADLIDVIESVEPAARPRVVIGHSYGGNVALALAARRPELVDAVVTYETPLSWRPWWPGTSAGADAVALRADPCEAAERFMRRLIGDERWERLPPSTRKSRRAEGPAMVGELIDLRASTPWEPGLIGVPVMAMYGGKGQDHHRLGAAAIAAEVHGAELVSLDDASHPGPNTHPDETAAEIERFIRSRLAT